MCRKQYNQARDKAKELMVELQTREIQQNIKLGENTNNNNNNKK